MNDLAKQFNYPGNPERVRRLTDYIEHAADPDLFHIDVHALASQWGMESRELLELFIYGLHAGIFRMEWQYHCPHCGGVANESLTLHEAKSLDYCGACKVNFQNKLDDNIEVFFSVHPEIKKIPPELKETYLKAMMNDVMKKKMFDWKHPSSISGADIIQNPVYRELLGEEVLLPDQSLELMKTTILFTDIKGSTQLYTDLGDSKAFQLVREHFRIIFAIIKKHHGVPVKTIGDAVMGAFTDQDAALEAALETQRTLIDYYSDKRESEKIEVKIGVHTGTTIIVTLNDRLDYFGSTVNMAARIQSMAKPNEVIISEPVFDTVGSKKIIARYTKTVGRGKTSFKGLAGEHTVYHIEMKKTGDMK